MPSNRRVQSSTRSFTSAFRGAGRGHCLWKPQLARDMPKHFVHTPTSPRHWHPAGGGGAGNGRGDVDHFLAGVEGEGPQRRQLRRDGLPGAGGGPDEGVEVGVVHVVEHLRRGPRACGALRSAYAEMDCAGVFQPRCAIGYKRVSGRSSPCGCPRISRYLELFHISTCCGPLCVIPPHIFLPVP